MNTRKVSAIKKIIDSNPGRLIGITFTKTDGTERKMTFRTGVKPVNSKISKPTIKRKETNEGSGMIDVFDIKNGFRAINLATTSRITVKGNTRTYR